MKKEPTYFEQAQILTRQRFGNTIQLFAPLYISNECVDICDYCGFSLTNKIRRKTLSIDEVLSEALFLKQEGFAHLLLVSGEDPRAVTPNYLADILVHLRPHFSLLSIEVAPFDTPTYQRLKESGLDRVVIYQETYDREAYARVHRAGPKKNYDRRLEAPERAARAGIRHIGMGILLGLSDWHTEAEALIQHVRSLQKKYWQTEFTVSFPRLRPCAGSYHPPTPISDEEYKELIVRTRIALPNVGIVLSTREAPELRDELIELGVTQISAGSKTNPGGYTVLEATTEQFEIADHRSPVEVAAMIQQKGLEPIWKDWHVGLS